MGRTIFITIFGLNTPADSDCFGLRGLMQSLAAPGDVAVFFAYDDPRLLAEVTRLAREFARVILCGHSHGGAAVKWILDQWGACEGARAQLAIFLDPAPEPLHFSQFFSWQAADRSLADRWHVPPAAERALCLYQRNEILLPGLVGVCGVPFAPEPVAPDVVCRVGQAAPPFARRVANVNVTGWGLYHCHMLGDVRVQGLVRAAVAAVAG